MFQECRNKSAVHNINIDLLSKSSIFSHTFAQIRSKPKNACNIQYIFLSLHAKISFIQQF